MEVYDKIRIVRSMAKGAEVLEDETVEDYLSSARDTVMNHLYPFRDTSGMEMPSKYDYVQIQICVYRINKRGAEGQTTHIEVGTERDFASADVPMDLLKEITPMCGFPE